MRTGTWNARTLSSLAVGLLVLAGICLLDGRPALAQLDCPSPRPDPPVTAQQVEDGSASLMDFALAATAQFKLGGSATVTPEELGRAGCWLRQEGGPWRSDSTYLVTLTPDGRVYLHAKDMSLSAGKLQSPIYAQILRALGTPLAVLQGLSSSDPTARTRAQAMLLAHLESEPHGPFNLTGGGSGYAAAYESVNTDQPLVLLTGFDLNASHLAAEAIDYGDPMPTASMVVDRYTLKAFVTEALRFIAGTVTRPDGSRLPTAESRVAFQKARLALRDPDGPWRHGPVYVTIQDPDTDLILFHGAFPNRFELRRGGISRDVVTGELIYQQLLDAANSSPEEGGFWLYHFDNPADDTDSAQVPKVGYARGFTRETTASDGTVIDSTRLIIASGFYLTSDGEFVQRILEALDDGQESMMFSITTPEDGGPVEGDDVDVTVTGAPTDTVHFAYRPAGSSEAFTYLGAATNHADGASFAWDTLDLPDDDYELVALYTEDEGEEGEGEMVIYDSIEVSVDNVGGGGGGCVAVPVLPGGGGPLDPTLPALVGLLLLYLMVGRRRPMRHAVI